MFCDPETAMCPEGPVNKCFINISSVKVNDSIKKTKTVFIEQNDTKICFENTRKTTFGFIGTKVVFLGHTCLTSGFIAAGH